MSTEAGAGFLTLRDRALAVLRAHGPLSEDALLAHVYGGLPPAALRAQLAAPLLADPRLERRDGAWSVRQPTRLAAEVTVVALAATGPTPGRGRVVHVAALYLAGSEVAGRFSVTVNPGRHVPGYVAARLGLDAAVLNEAPPLADCAAELVQFLGTRPVFAQDARLVWSFLEADLRQAGGVLMPTLLFDVNELCIALLELSTKPTLARVAQHLGIPVGRIEQPDEEARVLALVVPQLLQRAAQAGAPLPTSSDGLLDAPSELALRRGETVRALPDRPGIYVLRDAQQSALYVGKARRLRSRMASYVFRPLGPTRRLEGLVERVTAVDSAECETDLEALVLEEREIRRLQPRFNTVRQQRQPRTWLRLPPAPLPRRGKRQPAPPRIELVPQPEATAGAAYLGPFRNEASAEQARQLVRDVFELDQLRRTDPDSYSLRLRAAWQFLSGGEGELALQLVRERQRRAAATADQPTLRRCERLLHAIGAYNPRALLLPADPRQAAYAVLRPGPDGIEGFLVQHGICNGYALLEPQGNISHFATQLLEHTRPRSGPDDVDVVLHWLGSQRPPTQLVHLPDDPFEAVFAIEASALFLALAPGEA